MDAAARALAVSELVRMVVVRFDCPADRFSACLVNRTWSEVVIPLLYQHITVGKPKKWDHGPFTQILDPLYARHLPLLLQQAGHIRSLSLRYVDSAHFAAILAATPQLHSLVTMVGFDHDYTSPEGWTIHPSLFSSLPQRLRSLTLDFDRAICAVTDFAHLVGSAPPRLTHLALYDVTDWREAFAVVARLGQNVTHLEMFEDSDMTEDWQVPLFMWRRFANSLPRLTSLRASALLHRPNFAPQHLPPTLQYLDLRPTYFTSNYLLLQRFIDPSYLPDIRTLEVLDLWFPLYARITKPDKDPSYLPRDKADFNATVERTIAALEVRPRLRTSEATFADWRRAVQEYRDAPRDTGEQDQETSSDNDSTESSISGSGSEGH